MNRSASAIRFAIDANSCVKCQIVGDFAHEGAAKSANPCILATTLTVRKRT